MKCLAILSIISIGLLSSVRTDSCHLRELDLCAASGAGAKTVPATDEDIDKYCGLAKEAKECLLAYTDKCTTPIQKEMIGYAMHGVQEKNPESFCVKGNELRNNYLKHAACLVKVQPEEKVCVVDAQAAIEKIEEIPFQDKITAACCTYSRYKKCARDIVEAQCGGEAVEYGMMVVKMASSNLIDVVCQGYENNPQCASLLPPPGTSPKGNGKSLMGKLLAAYVKS